METHEGVLILSQLKVSGTRYEVTYEASGTSYTVTGALRDAYKAGPHTFVAIRDESERDAVYRHINVKYITSMKELK